MYNNYDILKGFIMKNKEELKNWIILILVAIISYWLINNISLIFSFLNKILNVIFPFVLGFILAYILNIPMLKIEKFLKDKIKNKKFPFRIISILLSLVMLVLIILFVAFMLIPELIENIELLIQNIPLLIEKIEVWILNLLSDYPDIQNEINSIFDNASFTSIIMSILNYILNSSISFISSLVSSIITIFTSLVFAIYMLSQKEGLIDSGKKLINAYIKKDYVNKIMDIGKQTNNLFTKFISGQCVEAVILGCIFFVVLTIFRFPYALIISVLTSITALIPVFGAFIAMVVGAILIAINNPVQALLFIVVFLVIQQIEGNLIYPKVVGKSVGLSPIWTLFAITVGGGLFGIVGMLIGLPVASVIYSLIVNEVNKRLKNNIQPTEQKETIESTTVYTIDPETRNALQELKKYYKNGTVVNLFKASLL